MFAPRVAVVQRLALVLNTESFGLPYSYLKSLMSGRADICRIERWQAILTCDTLKVALQREVFGNKASKGVTSNMDEGCYILVIKKPT